MAREGFHARGADLVYLAINAAQPTVEPATFLTQPTPKFHGSVPGMIEESQKLIHAGTMSSLSCRTREKWNG